MNGKDYILQIILVPFRNLKYLHLPNRCFSSASKTVYPPSCDVFSALNTLSIDKVKVVIVGQDPYHQPNQGHGMLHDIFDTFHHIEF